MQNLYFLLSISILLLFGCEKNGKGPWSILPPAGKEYVVIHPDGRTILPNGRYLTPLGRHVFTAPHPYGLAISQDGSIAVTANSGIAPISITIIHDLDTDHPQSMQVPEGANTDRGILASVFMGLAISGDNKQVYVSGGQENKIFMFDLYSGKKTDSICCSRVEGRDDYTHGYLGDMKLTRDGKILYVLDQIGFRLLVIDLAHKKIVHTIPTGRYPFGLTLSPDEKTVYVANVGMYQYSLIKSVDFKNLDKTALDFPVAAYQSKESIDGMHTDTLDFEGLGDPNVPESFSVWAFDMSNADQPVVKAKIKTGFLVGEKINGIPAVGGSSPNSLVATDKYVFVSNGSNDCISVIDPAKDTVVSTIFLSPDERLRHLRGIIPFGITRSPDNKRIFVAEAGLNAVAVIDAESFTVLGHIPCGWFPAKLEMTGNGKKLVVSSAKGFGCGPNGGPQFKKGPEGLYIGSLMKGTVSIMDVPSAKALKKLTRQVVSNNFRFIRSEELMKVNAGNPVPSFPGLASSPIKHLVFISKENRTYDEVFGQLKDGKGEPSLARYGEKVSFSNADKTSSLQQITVMPNHLSLARRFTIADNFYVDADVSADGHRWLACTYPNEWVESSVPSAYGGSRGPRMDSKAPGNWGMEVASGALYPEDYNEAGSLWEQLDRHGIDFYNFGFGIMMEPQLNEQQYTKTGYKFAVNYPVPAPMFNKTSRTYPTFNMMIPDQFRVDRFIEECRSKWIDRGLSLPSMLTIIVPNDHGAGERPAEGYPYRESYMADNDLAVGRIIEFLSHTPDWNSMAIVIVEDDAQGGVDHIDGHRSVLMLVSPFARKGFVGHEHYSFGSVFKSFWNILGLPYLNQYDAGASDLADLFTDMPDYTPYHALPVDTRLFDPQKALDPFDASFNWKSLSESPVIDDPEDMLKWSEEDE